MRKGRSLPYSGRQSAGGAQKHDIFVLSHNRGPRQGSRDSDGHGHGGREDSTSSEHRRRTDNAAANKAREDRKSSRHRRAGDMRADIRAQHPTRHGRAQRIHAVRQSRRCGYPRGTARSCHRCALARGAEDGEEQRGHTPPARSRDARRGNIYLLRQDGHADSEQNDRHCRLLAVGRNSIDRRRGEKAFLPCGALLRRKIRGQGQGIR